MIVEINARGNGACPICDSHEKCRIQDTLVTAIKDFSVMENPMEIVIYSCPQFQEKSHE